MSDEIMRTNIVGLGIAHNTLKKRLVKEVTPWTINEYLRIINHAMPGGAVVHEHMVETKPGLSTTALSRYLPAMTRIRTILSRCTCSKSRNCSRKNRLICSRPRLVNQCTDHSCPNHSYPDLRRQHHQSMVRNVDRGIGHCRVTEPVQVKRRWPISRMWPSMPL